MEPQEPSKKVAFTSKARKSTIDALAKQTANISLDPEAKPFNPQKPLMHSQASGKKTSESPTRVESKANSTTTTTTTTTTTDNNNSSASTTKKRARPPVAKPQLKTESLLETEVKQLKIRFQPHGYHQKHLPNADYELSCVLPITDPDFPYDLATMRLLIQLPSAYPGTETVPVRPIISILNTDLPTSITGRLARHLRVGAASMPGGVLIVRPLIKYLEENLERWMVDDPSEKAFKFVPAQEIKITDRPEQSRDGAGRVLPPSNSVQLANAVHTSSPTPPDTPTPTTTTPPSRIQPGEWIAAAPDTDQSSISGNGTYSLTLSFSLLQGIDLLILPCLNILVCCDRCKYTFALEALRSFIDRIEHCPKCTNQSKFHYRREYMRPEGDGCVLQAGVVRAVRAKLVDLLPTTVQVACARCFGAEEPGDLLKSQVRIESVKVGELIACTCFSCHRSIKLSIDQARFLGNEVPFAPRKPASSVTSTGVSFTPGKSLPLNGACEHYKKSYRWYRFPCCGLAFPCDECHAADPVAGKHAADWACRFVCGFCAREQPITNKECTECGREGKRKSTCFWEGGKGVRNQVLMSKKDSKKYKDYGSKSASKKSKGT